MGVKVAKWIGIGAIGAASGVIGYGLGVWKMDFVSFIIGMVSGVVACFSGVLLAKLFNRKNKK